MNIVKVLDISLHVFADCILHFMNDAGVLVKLNGITGYFKSPCVVQKAVFHLSPAAILISLYPFFSYKLMNHFKAIVLASNSQMSDRGYMISIIRQF